MQPLQQQLGRWSSSFVGIGIVTIVIYFLMWWIYRESPHALPRLQREFFIWGAVISLIACYWQGFRLIQRRPKGFYLYALLGFAALFSVMALYTVPFHSTDLYGYINRGWQQVAYGMNPYAYVIDDIPHWNQDPMLTNHWVNNPCPYGFLFAGLAYILCLLGGGEWVLTLFLFKGLNVFAHWATAWLLWTGARKLNAPRPDLILFLYLWNPLIVMHQLVNGHNDILMGTLATLGIYLALIGAWIWVLPVLIASALVKYASAVLIPVAMVYIGRQAGWAKLLQGCLVGALTFFALSLPYLLDWQHFRLQDMGSNATLTHNSFHAMIFHSYKSLGELVFPALLPTVDLFKNTLKQLLWGSYLLSFAGVLLWMLRTRALNFFTFLTAGVLLQAGLICVVSSKFYAWYLGMFFPMALLLPEGFWLRRLIVVLSCTLLLAFTFLGQAHIANYLVMMLTPTAIILGHEWRNRHKQIPLPAEPLKAASGYSEG